MPLFVCDNCHAIENTILGNYWCRGKYGLPEKALCCECMPTTFNSELNNSKYGKWHNRFPKVIATTKLILEYGEENFVYVSDIKGVKAKR